MGNKLDPAGSGTDSQPFALWRKVDLTNVKRPLRAWPTPLLPSPTSGSQAAPSRGA